MAYVTSVIARERKEHELKIAKEKLAKILGASALESSLDHVHFFELRAPDSIENYRANLARIPDMLRFSHIRMEKESLLDLERARAIPDLDFSLGVRDFKGRRRSGVCFFPSRFPSRFLIKTGGMSPGSVRKLRGQRAMLGKPN